MRIHTVSQTVDSNRQQDGVSETILKYRPMRTPAGWGIVRDFVVDCALAVEPPNVKWAQDLLGALSGFVIWAHFTAHVPLDRDKAFDPRIINRYVNQRTTWSLKHRQLREALLHRAAEALGRNEAPRTLNMVITDARPYLRSDIPELVAWAQQQSNERTRKDAYALIGFCGGAGLRGRELAALRYSDVEVTDQGIFITVDGDYPRRIAVRPEWERYIHLSLTVDAEPDSFVAVPHAKTELRERMLANFGRRAQGHAPRAARLRVTWVVHYLDILPLGALLKAAGYKTPASLRRYVDLAATPEDDSLFALLRGERGPA
jgi:integrase